MEWGFILAYVGVAIAVFLSGCGSARGVSMAAQAGAGIVAEQPEHFSKVLILEALPGTQGIYGFLVGVLLMALKLGTFSGDVVSISTAVGLQVLLGCLPIGIVGYFSAVMQGKAAVAAIHMVGRRPEESGKGVTMTVLVETYAVLAFLVSLLSIIFIKV
nr:V-type ATP synthase subunit K [bacterium]